MHTTDTELRMYNTFKIVPRADNDNDNGGGGHNGNNDNDLFVHIFTTIWYKETISHARKTMASGEAK